MKYKISMSIDVKDAIDGVDTLLDQFSYKWEYDSEIGNTSNISLGVLTCDRPLLLYEEKQVCRILSTRIEQNMPNYKFSIQCVRK